jgi:hypothetical protein
MARAAMKYAFAALLALLSTQAFVPSTRVVVCVEIVCGNEAEEQTPQKAPPIRTDGQVRRNALNYVSRTIAAPDTAALFQRPPPLSFLFS